MSGILNPKQRIMDFTLTREGYEQIQNGDLRIKYATFNDRNAIYDNLENTFNTADINAMPFLFENFNTLHDTINQEIDLNVSLTTENLSNNISLTTDYQSNQLKIENGKLVTSSSDIDQIFTHLSQTTNRALSNSSILLSDNFINFDPDLGTNKSISLKLKKINDNITNNNLEDIILLNDNDNFHEEFNSGSYYTLLEDSITLSDKSLFEDSRFLNKLPFLFLPPLNMNTNVVSKNNSVLNTYNTANDNRSAQKLIYKNLKNTKNVSIQNVVEIKPLSTNREIINSVKNLDLLSKNKIAYNKTDSNGQIVKENIDNSSKILSFEMEFDDIEENCPFLFQVYESNINENYFNKLLVIDHGEIYDNELQKNVHIFLVGKIFHSKTDVDLQDIETNRIINNVINKDNYLFINLFTIMMH